ncbi:MAG: hypothetical protein WBD36_13950 [Bacteroidota bacterium]
MNPVSSFPHRALFALVAGLFVTSAAVSQFIPRVPGKEIVSKPMPIVYVRFQPTMPTLDYRLETFHLSIWPGDRTSFGEGYLVVNNISLNLFLGSTARVRGFEMGLFANHIREHAQGFQLAGVTNGVEEFFQGAQIAGASNVTRGDFYGAQLAFGYNHALNFAGVQAALVNNADWFAGVQAGGVNMAGGQFVGVQAGYAANFVGNILGLQVGGMNKAKNVTGVQAGGLNFASNVDGMQVGVFNMADRNNGVALGLLNWIGDGQNSFEFVGNEAEFGQLNYKHGTKYFHIIYSLGVRKLDKPFRWTVGGGMGAQLIQNPFSLNLDVLVHRLNGEHSWESGVFVLNEIRSTASVEIVRGISLVLGGHVNVYVSSRNEEAFEGRGTLYPNESHSTFTRVWPGFILGFKIGR